MLCYRASGACELLYDYGHWSHYPVSPVLARIHWAVHPYPPGLHPLRTPLCEVSGSPWQLRTRPNVLCCLRLPHCTTGSKCGSPSQVVAIPGSLHCAQPFFLHDLGGGFHRPRMDPRSPRRLRYPYALLPPLAVSAGTFLTSGSTCSSSLLILSLLLFSRPIPSLHRRRSASRCCLALHPTAKLDAVKLASSI